jgi:hypothetical protein
LLLCEIAAPHRRGEDRLKAISHSDIQPTLDGARLHARRFGGCRYSPSVSQHRECHDAGVATEVELK